MGKIKTYFSYLPKHPVAIFAGVLMAVTLTATAIAGFGPDRPTKAYSDGVAGFDHVTFNSFTGVPGIGDERQFYVGKYAGETTYHPTLNNLREGDEVTMKVYIHNNADSSLNASGEGVAKDVNVKVEIPDGTNLTTVSRAEISASNAQPQTIWSSVDFAAENGGFFALDYVEGSATITDLNGTRAISDSLVTTGVNIGDVRGCFEYAASIDFKIKINSPNYEIKKEVAVPGEPWTEVVERDVNEEASWLLTFENKGSTDLNDVIVVDELPPHNTVVPGSVQLIDSNFPNGYTYNDDEAIQANGTQINVNTGDVPVGSGFYIKYKTTINADIPDLNCNRYRFQNVAYATPEGYSPVSDEAFVEVEGPCNPEEPFVRCNVLNASIISGRTVEVAADVEKSADVTITGYEFNWGDGNTSESESNTARHTYDADGNYTIVATVNHEGGQSTAVTCEADISFNTPVTPEYPPELPNTGPAAALAGLFGTGTLAGATHAWVNSRRALKKSLLG